jgi:hypothetical protein
MSVIEKVLAYVRQQFPNGHPSFARMCVENVALHDAKSHDYASGGAVFGNFERVAAILGQYQNLDLSDPRVVAMVYSLKQTDAVLWSLSQGHTARVEGRDGRLADIAVYMNLVRCMDEDARTDAA